MLPSALIQLRATDACRWKCPLLSRAASVALRMAFDMLQGQSPTPSGVDLKLAGVRRWGKIRARSGRQVVNERCWDGGRTENDDCRTGIALVAPWLRHPGVPAAGPPCAEETRTEREWRRATSQILFVNLPASAGRRLVRFGDSCSGNHHKLGVLFVGRSRPGEQTLRDYQTGSEPHL